jgi:inner membrane protein
MGAALTTLYGYLYLLLRLEDYALLAGSVGLFAMLALVMYLTRRVNWYDLRLGGK